MFYSRTTRPLLLILGLAALLVTGCGGGGDDGVKEDLRAQVDMLEADLAAGREAQTAAETAKETAEAAQATAEKERDDANIAKGAAEELMRMAQQAQQEADTARQEAETAKMMAETAQRQAVMSRDAALQDKMQAETDLAAANTSKSMTEGELDMVRQDLADANIALTTANTNLQAANANLMTANANLATAIQERDDARTAEQQARIELARVEGQLDQARQQLTQAQQDVLDAERESQQARQEADRRVAEAEVQANIRLRAGPLLTALGAGALMEEEAVTVEHMRGQSLKFEPTGNYRRGSAAPSISGWRSASFSREIGVTATESIYLYTNIGSPGSKAFWKVYGDEVGTGEFEEDLAAPSSFGRDRSLYQNSNGDAEERDGVTRGGSYDNVSGTFSCATTCNMTADAEGEISFEGEWSFKASPTAGVRQDQDTEYLYFGIWTSEPVDAAMPHGFKWIAGGGNAIDNTNFLALEGTATLNGSVIGKYVLRNQVGQNDRIGTFTADAAFTAQFGASPTLDGRITGLSEDGSSLGSNWNVYLGATASTAATLANTGVRAGVATASIGGVSATGAWSASLHGSDNPGYTDFGDETNQIDCPVSGGCPAADLAGVAGWFNAKSGDTVPLSNAAIAGAFAAAP